jgi:DNA helicase-2/ATP-dependent DNA helicase PcrA
MKVQIDPEAYKSELGPILLLAGPGTGKTYQLAKRIQYLTSEKGISPDEITVITFTSEAATGMKQKIEEVGSPEYIESEKRPGRISTMHSLGQSILLNQPDAFGLDDKF